MKIFCRCSLFHYWSG